MNAKPWGETGLTRDPPCAPGTAPPRETGLSLAGGACGGHGVLRTVGTGSAEAGEQLTAEIPAQVSGCAPSHTRAATGTHAEAPARVVVNGFTISAIQARGGCHSHFRSTHMKVGQAQSPAPGCIKLETSQNRDTKGREAFPAPQGFSLSAKICCSPGSESCDIRLEGWCFSDGLRSCRAGVDHASRRLLRQGKDA